ncbi:MAG TPA: hypothetical protein VGV36_06520 [Solirubrobacteraceae bacterium]|nr:hypothetical protein [Solirubrobacteraceae bacterium]
MTTALLAVGVVLAALACPAMMWWNARRGRHSPCCRLPPARDAADVTLEELREEHQRLEAMIADAEAHQRSTSPAVRR